MFSSTLFKKELKVAHNTPTLTEKTFCSWCDGIVVISLCESGSHRHTLVSSDPLNKYCPDLFHWRQLTQPPWHWKEWGNLTLEGAGRCDVKLIITTMFLTHHSQRILEGSGEMWCSTSNNNNVSNTSLTEDTSKFYQTVARLITICFKF